VCEPREGFLPRRADRRLCRNSPVRPPNGSNRAGIYTDRGRAYYDKKDYDRAIADYDEALKINPNLVPAYNDRGVAHHDRRDHDRAITNFNEAIRINPNYALAYSNRGRAYHAKGDSDRAIADYNEALRINPSYVLAYYNRGRAYHAKGDSDRAIADYDEAIRRNPELAKRTTTAPLATSPPPTPAEASHTSRRQTTTVELPIRVCHRLCRLGLG